MNLHKNHEGKSLKEFNAHLRNEVRELKDKLAVADKCKTWAYNELLKACNQLRQAESRAERYKFSNGLLEKEIEQLKGGSIFTVSKRETELERQLKSECARADELSAQFDTVSKRYEETQNAVTELMDENTMLKAKLEKYEKTKKGDANS